MRLIADIFVINGFRGWLIAVTLTGMALLLVYLLWRVLSLRRNPSPKDPENLTPFYDDEDLEGPRLERALGWSLIFVMVVASSRDSRRASSPSSRTACRSTTRRRSACCARRSARSRKRT